MSIRDDRLNGGDVDGGCLAVVFTGIMVIFGIMLYLVTLV